MHLDNWDKPVVGILDIYENKCDGDPYYNHFITTHYSRNRRYTIDSMSGKLALDEEMLFTEQDQQVMIESYDQIESQEVDPISLSFKEQAQQVTSESYDQIKPQEVNPISLWKVLLLVGTGVALAVAVLFGFNSWLAFITIFSNPLSKIIGVAAFALVAVLLVIAHETNVFKIGKLFASEKYKNYSFFYLRKKENRDKQPDMSVPIRSKIK